MLKYTVCHCRKVNPLCPLILTGLKHNVHPSCQKMEDPATEQNQHWVKIQLSSGQHFHNLPYDREGRAGYMKGSQLWGGRRLSTVLKQRVPHQGSSITFVFILTCPPFVIFAVKDQSRNNSETYTCWLHCILVSMFMQVFRIQVYLPQTEMGNKILETLLGVNI